MTDQSAGGVEITGLDGSAVRLTAEQLESLASSVAGDVLRPGHAGWDESVLIWNAMAAQVPSVVLRPASVDDVVAGVRFAADHGLLLSIKGGGHNIAGTSMAPGGFTLDMSGLREVSVDRDGRRAHVGAGCLLKHVDAATQAHGLAAVVGFVSETGVAGLTLGGGFGYLTRRFGWTVDNLAEVEIVTADGQVLVASRDSHPDLFWAVRGGGGNFGVVTRFTFVLHEVGPTITGGLIAWSAERAEEVLATYRQVAAAAPRELTMAAAVRLAPPAPFVPPDWHGKPIVAIIACHSGSDPAGDLAPIRALGDPVVDLITEKPYVEQQAMLDATQPKGLNYYWKTEFFSELPDAFLDEFRTRALGLTSPMSQSILFHLGGALSERDADDGAVGNRDANFVGGFAACWPPTDAAGDDHVAWARDSWQAVRGFSTGGNYVNFQVADDDPSRIHDAYGANLERLGRVKARYDPHNLFRVNRNLAPSG